MKHFYQCLLTICFRLSLCKAAILALLLSLCTLNINAQAPAIEWQKTIGGSGEDNLRSIQQTADGGYILAGHSSSGISGDKTETSKGGDDYWVIKLNPLGNIVWQKTIGGSGSDILESIQQTMDGGYILGGFSNSGISGDKTENSKGMDDYWVVRLNNAGNIVWQKTIGGSNYDRLFSIQQTSDSGYILGGFSSSGISGDKTEASKGGDDYWVIKIDTVGNIVWQKTIGGSNNDLLLSIQQTSDGGYILGGFSSSGISGDKTEASKGGDDNWVIKLDTVGNISWQKNIGGSGVDRLYSVQQVAGEGYILGGYSGSGISGDKTEALIGIEDYWVIKLDTVGNISWQKNIGGSGVDRLYSVQQVAGEGYIIGGYSWSGISGDKTENSKGMDDYWVVKLNNAGNIVWQKTIGGSFNDRLFSIQQTSDSGYILGGISESGISGDKTEASKGGIMDIWIVKINTPTSLIQGKVFIDKNVNCTSDTSDLSLPGFLVIAEPGPFYGLSDANGNYSIALFDTGSYTISLASQDTLWQNNCTASYNVHISDTTGTITGLDFAITAAYYCPRLTVDVTTPLLRRCFDNTYYFHYSNTGTLLASGVFIEVDFGPHFQPQSSTIPWTSFSGNIYTFPIGNLNINQTGSFQVTGLLSCDAQLGSTQCVTARILPDFPCGNPDPVFDRRQVYLHGQCVAGDSVEFKIWNAHDSISHSGYFQLFVNSALADSIPFSLAPHDTMTLLFPANGNTLRLEVNFVVGSNTYGGLQYTVECCGPNPVWGNVNTLPQNDNALNIETFCITVIGAYDPNDKSVFPEGLTTNKFIKDDTQLEYLIRFQNTGTDTAFTVIIRDTLSSYLDIPTIQLGSGSHEYEFNIYGQVIAEWTFNNILLPDSHVNEPSSHGFVKYKIRQNPGNSPVTLIENRAGIYFDFNEPVITNTVFNTVYDTVLICEKPVAQFTFSQNGTELTLNNQITIGQSYYWDMGDNSSYTTASPVHQYSVPGTYTICLTAFNACGPSSKCETVTVTHVPAGSQKRITIHPNPTRSGVVVQWDEQLRVETIILRDINSKLIEEVKLAGETNYELKMLDFPRGLYFITIKGNESKTMKVVKVE